MTLNVSFAHLKTIAIAVLVACTVFSTYEAVTFRRFANSPAWGVIEFDLNNRLPAIQAEAMRQQLAQAQAAAKAAPKTDAPVKKSK
jgi:hypothetical protein